LDGRKNHRFSVSGIAEKIMNSVEAVLIKDRRFSGSGIDKKSWIHSVA